MRSKVLQRVIDKADWLTKLKVELYTIKIVGLIKWIKTYGK